MKIGKKDCGQYSLRGITLGQRGNFCGYIDVEVVAIDYGSESVLLSGFNKVGITIKELSKKELKKVYYIKKAKENDYNMWVSIDAIEKYDNKEKEVYVEETKDISYDEDMFNKFVEAVRSGNVYYGEEFRVRIGCSSSVIEHGYCKDAEIVDIKVFVIDYDFSNSYDILSKHCNMNDSEQLEKILDSPVSYIFDRKTVTEEIINDLYLEDSIFAYEKLDDGRIIIIVRPE